MVWRTGSLNANLGLVKSRSQLMQTSFNFNIFNKFDDGRRLPSGIKKGNLQRGCLSLSLKTRKTFPGPEPQPGGPCPFDGPGLFGIFPCNDNLTRL